MPDSQNIHRITVPGGYYNEQFVEEIRIVRKWIIELVGYNGYTPEESKELLRWCLDELCAIVGKANMYWKELGASYTKEKYLPCAKLDKAINNFHVHLDEKTMDYLVVFFQKLDTEAKETGIPLSLLETTYSLLRFDKEMEPYIKARSEVCNQCKCSSEEVEAAEKAVAEVITTCWSFSSCGGIATC